MIGTIHPDRNSKTCPHGTVPCSGKSSQDWSNQVCIKDIKDPATGKQMMNCPITSVNIVPKKSQQARKEGYEYRAFDSEFDLETSIHDNNLPLTKFRANSAKPCMDMASATSFDNSDWLSDAF